VVLRVELHRLRVVVDGADDAGARALGAEGEAAEAGEVVDDAEGHRAGSRVSCDASRRKLVLIPVPQNGQKSQ
jgi:hypothetical protein